MVNPHDGSIKGNVVVLTEVRAVLDGLKVIQRLQRS